MNYRIGDDATKAGNVFADGPSALDMDRFSLHGQTTYVAVNTPFHFTPRITAPTVSRLERGARDLGFHVICRRSALAGRRAVRSTPRLIAFGFGLSNTLGITGFTSGEAYKVGASVPYARLPRMFVRQTIDLGGETQKLSPPSTSSAIRDG